MRARFVGALSFEDRATCGLGHLVDQLTDVVMLDYGSRATPGQEARTAREGAWNTVVEVASRASITPSRVEMNPYSMRDLEDKILDWRGSHTFIDISCLTRPHVIAAARACVELSRHGANWSVAYTTPVTYGNHTQRVPGFGWRDTLVLPIGRDPSASNEGLSLGLIILGQEAERLQIALDEVEPAAGFVIHIIRRDRPDLYRRTLASNELVRRHLQSLKMPGERAHAIRPMFPSLGWVERGLNLEDLFASLSEVVNTVVSAARAATAPIFLYPFGPKVSGFAAAMMLATRYPEASWSIYPIAVTHPLDYSEGCSHVSVLPASSFSMD